MCLSVMGKRKKKEKQIKYIISDYSIFLNHITQNIYNSCTLQFSDISMNLTIGFNLELD